MGEQNLPARTGQGGASREFPTWFWNTVADGVALLLENPGMERAPRGDAVDGAIALFARGLWEYGLPEDEAWNEVLDQWRIARAFSQILAHSNRFPTFKALLYQLPARQTEPEIDPEERNRLVAERLERSAKEGRATQPLALPAPQGPKPINRDEAARKTTAQRFRELREALMSKQTRSREGAA